MYRGAMKNNHGYTLTELIITMVVFAVVAISTYTLLTGYIVSSAAAQMKAAAVGIATAETEALRELPYNALAVQGGSILIAGQYLPAQKEIVRSSRKFIVNTDIRYVDDAYDGCFTYGSIEDRDRYCRNGPPDGAKPADTNPRDYKVAQVIVKDAATNQVLSTVSSYYAARVAEVASDTAVISVKVTDMTGAGVPGATVRLQNTTSSPVIDQTITTDDLGSALFMDIVPDAQKNYVVTASKVGYSTLQTIAASGALTPTYPNVSAIAQHMTNATLMINPLSANSLALRLVNTSGAGLSGVQVSLKGGIKLFNDPNDTQYSYTNTLTTDANGDIFVASLVPGAYTITAVSGRHVVSVHTATGQTSFQPFDVPPGTTPPGGMTSMQSVLVMASSSGTFPVIESLSPTSVSSADVNIADTLVTVRGKNLSGATVRLVGKTSGAVVTGSLTATADEDTLIVRSFNLQGASQEGYRLELTNGGNTVVQDTLAPSVAGGFSVTP